MPPVDIDTPTSGDGGTGSESPGPKTDTARPGSPLKEFVTDAAEELQEVNSENSQILKLEGHSLRSDGTSNRFQTNLAVIDLEC